MPSVLVACEFSGVVRNAFSAKGWDSTSCDLLPTEQQCINNSRHIKGDVRSVIQSEYFDLIIAHPPCTYLCRSGIQWVKKRNKEVEQQEALLFVKYLLNCNIPAIALENPIGIISTQIRKPDQIIQPWMFGVGETKATCLWLKNLPLLQATDIVNGRKPVIHYTPPSKDRWKVRSRTYQCIANAMAQQWSNI